MPKLPEQDPFGLIRQPATRCPALDTLLDAAYDAYEDDQVVMAMYWFVLVDLRGVRSYAGEIMACVAKWNALGCPPQEESIGESFSRDQYEFGWSSMLWFSQTMPDAAVDWFVQASSRGNRDARMFGFKFLGAILYRSGDRGLTAFGTGHSEPIVLSFMVCIVILLFLMLIVGLYFVANYVGR